MCIIVYAAMKKNIIFFLHKIFIFMIRLYVKNSTFSCYFLSKNAMIKVYNASPTVDTSVELHFSVGKMANVNTEKRRKS